MEDTKKEDCSVPIDKECSNLKVEPIQLDDLECPLCLQIYKNPKFLPCHHTFCESCIADLVRKSGFMSVACPVCRKPTHLSLPGVAGLQSNFYITKWLPDSTLICHMHRTERFRFLCLTCDNRPLCCKCLLPGHARHDLRDLDEAITEAQSRLKEVESELRTSIKQQSDELKKLKKTEDTVRKTQEDLKTAFKKRVNTLKQNLDCALRDSITDLDRISAEQISSLEQTQPSMENQLLQARNLEETVRETLAGTNTLDMVRLCHQQASTRQVYELTSVVHQPELNEIVQDFDDSQSDLNQVTSFVGRVRQVNSGLKQARISQVDKRTSSELSCTVEGKPGLCATVWDSTTSKLSLNQVDRTHWVCGEKQTSPDYVSHLKDEKSESTKSMFQRSTKKKNRPQRNSPDMALKEDGAHRFFERSNKTESGS